MATAPTGPGCSESAQVGGVRHNLRMPIQRWRCPVVLRVKAVVLAAAGVAVALVFFPLWLAVPVAALKLFAPWPLLSKSHESMWTVI